VRDLSAQAGLFPRHCRRDGPVGIRHASSLPDCTHTPLSPPLQPTPPHPKFPPRVATEEAMARDGHARNTDGPERVGEGSIQRSTHKSTLVDRTPLLQLSTPPPGGARVKRRAGSAGYIAWCSTGCRHGTAAPPTHLLDHCRCSLLLRTVFPPTPVSCVCVLHSRVAGCRFATRRRRRRPSANKKKPGHAVARTAGQSHAFCPDGTWFNPCERVASARKALPTPATLGHEEKAPHRAEVTTDQTADPMSPRAAVAHYATAAAVAAVAPPARLPPASTTHRDALTQARSRRSRRLVGLQVALFAADLDWVEAHEEMAMVRACAAPQLPRCSHRSRTARPLRPRRCHVGGGRRTRCRWACPRLACATYSTAHEPTPRVRSGRESTLSPVAFFGGSCTCSQTSHP